MVCLRQFVVLFVSALSTLQQDVDSVPDGGHRFFRTMLLFVFTVWLPPYRPSRHKNLDLEQLDDEKRGVLAGLRNVFSTVVVAGIAVCTLFLGANCFVAAPMMSIVCAGISLCALVRTLFLSD